MFSELTILRTLGRSIRSLLHKRTGPSPNQNDFATQIRRLVWVRLACIGRIGGIVVARPQWKTEVAPVLMWDRVSGYLRQCALRNERS